MEHNPFAMEDEGVPLFSAESLHFQLLCMASDHFNARLRAVLHQQEEADIEAFAESIITSGIASLPDEITTAAQLNQICRFLNSISRWTVRDIRRCFADFVYQRHREMPAILFDGHAMADEHLRN